MPTPSTQQAAACGEETLSKTSSELLKRFVDQEMSTRSLRKQIEALNARSADVEAEKKKMETQKQKEEQLYDGLENLAGELRKKKAEVLQTVKDKEVQEQEARQALNTRFQGKLAEITTQMESDAEAQMAAVNENKRLRIKLSNLGQQVDLKAQQYEQLIKTRDVEVRLSEAKAEHLREMTKGDLCRMEIQEKQLAEEKESEGKLKVELEGITAKFTELQDAIVKSNTMFKEYKSEMDKLTKKVKLLDNEKSEILKRYATKTRPHDTARAEAAVQREKLAKLKQQGEGVSGLVKILQKEATDFEAWKKACPEEFEKAQAEHKASQK